jgi:UDP-glucose-4-epimerase GalE
VRVLVTGGAGYIGSETVRLLAARGHEPVVIDTLERGHRAAIDGIPLIVGSVADGELVEQAIRSHGIGSVVHFAALKSVEDSFADPAGYFATNVGGSFALLGAMGRAGLTDLVYSSSCAVYGTPSDLPVRETSELRPENPYGETKLLVERALRWFDGAGIRSVSLRYFNAAGAAFDGRHGEDWTDAPNLVPVVIKAALGRGPAVRVLGTDYPTPDGTAIRDYIHVTDLAEAHVLAVEALGRGLASTTLNLGTGQGSSVRQVIDAVARAAGNAVPTIDAPRRAGDPAAIWADASRAEAEIGWRTRHGLEAIVDTAWRWHSTHLDGYGDADPGRASLASKATGAA